MAALPYMQFYVADYLADTMHLTAEEHGAYLLLIFNYWQTGKPLPNNDQRLSIIARLSNERWTDVKQTLLEFFVVSRDKLTHPRVEADLEFIEEKQRKAVMAGKASALARAAKKKTKDNTRSTSVETPVADTLQRIGNHSESESESESESYNNPVEKPAVLNGSVGEIFHYWQETLNHPRAKLDDKRKKKIKALLKIGYTVDDIKTAINGCKVSPFHQGQNDRSMVFDDIELICRDASHLDRFIKTATGIDPNVLSEHGRRAVSVAQSWMEKKNAKT